MSWITGLPKEDGMYWVRCSVFPEGRIMTLSHTGRRDEARLIDRTPVNKFVSINTWVSHYPTPVVCPK